MNRQYYFCSKCVIDFFARLLETKKLLREENVDFNLRGKENVIQASLTGEK